MVTSILSLHKAGDGGQYTKSVLKQTLSHIGDYSSRAVGGGYPTKLATND